MSVAVFARTLAKRIEARPHADVEQSARLAHARDLARRLAEPELGDEIGGVDHLGPGKMPAAMGIDIDDNGEIVGLS